MKKKPSIMILLICFFSTSAYAADKWDKTDYSLLTAMIIVDVLDWQQTRYIANHPGEYREHNLILGNHPSQGEVDAYFALASTGQVLIAHYLPSKYRKLWLGLWIGIEGSYVASNSSIGIKMQF